MKQPISNPQHFAAGKMLSANGSAPRGKQQATAMRNAGWLE